MTIFLRSEYMYGVCMDPIVLLVTTDQFKLCMSRTYI